MRLRPVRALGHALSAIVVIILSGCSGGGGGDAAPPEARLIGAGLTVPMETGVRTGRTRVLSGPGLRGYRYQSLAFDTDRDELYALASDEGVVVAIDRTTGAGVAAYGNPLFETQQLAYDPTRRQLVALSFDARRWYGPTTGQVTAEDQVSISSLEALAYDPGSKAWYQVSGGDLERFDFEAGESIEHVGPTSVSFLRPATIDPSAGVLYGIDIDENLVAVDLETGVDTTVGWTGYSQLLDLVFDTELGVLWALEAGDQLLLRIDPATADSTVVSTFARPRLTGAAQDPVTGTLWAVDGLDARLYVVDPVTARATLIGSLDSPDVRGLAYDSTQARLLCIDEDSGHLIEIDPLTAEVTVIGDTGFDRVESLAHRPADDTLYGISNETGELIAIDTATGAGTAVASLNLFDVRGLTVEPASGHLVTHREFSISSFFSIDPDTYALTALTPILGGGMDAFVFEQGTGALIGFSAPTRDLVEIELDTGQRIPRGRLGGSIGAAAYDRAADLLFVYDNGNGLLHTLDGRTHERLNSVVPDDLFGPESLAMDQSSKQLYGMTSDGELWLVDAETGDTTFVGDSGTRPNALAFHQPQGVLYASGWDSGAERLWVVDPGGGSASLVGTPVDPDDPGTQLSFAGLTYDVVSGRLYGVTYDQRLYRIDPATAQCTFVANVGGDVQALGGRAR